MNLARALPLLALAALAPACTVSTSSDSEQVGSQASAFTFLDGPGGGGGSWYLSGRTLNGRSWNGKVLTGLGLEAVSYAGVVLQDGTSATAKLDGSQLAATDAKGRPVPAAKKLTGAMFSGRLSDGDALALRIDAVGTQVIRGDKNVSVYAVSFAGESGWSPLCGTNADGSPVQALALAGRWNYGVGVPGGGSHIDDPATFTFACQGYVLSKCVELGYRPWEADRAPVFQACTRALRADYCGDGTPYTVDGVLIDVYDGLGLRSPSPGWPFEAEWTPSGARCAARLREPSLGTPRCWAALQSDDCGDLAHFASGTDLMSQESQ